MPIASRYDLKRDLTIFAVAGGLALEDQMAVLHAFYAGKPSRNVLWDFRKLEDKRISSRWIKEKT